MALGAGKLDCHGLTICRFVSTLAEQQSAYNFLELVMKLLDLSSC